MDLDARAHWRVGLVQLDIAVAARRLRCRDSHEPGEAPPAELQERFLLACIDGGEANDAFDRFQRAARLVALAAKIDGAGRVGTPPTRPKDAAALAPFVGDTLLIEAGAAALERAGAAHGVHTQGLFWSLATLLALAGGASALHTLEELALAVERSGVVGDLVQLQRSVSLSSHPDVARLRARLEEEIQRRERETPARRIVEAMGLVVPGAAWMVTLRVGARAGQAPGSFEYPVAELALEGPWPRWSIRVRKSASEESAFHDEGTVLNQLGLHVATGPSDLMLVLDSAAAKLGLEWNRAQPVVSLSGFGGGKELVLAWFAKVAARGA